MQWLAEICIKRPIFATMLILAITVAGGFSFFSLGVDRFPNVDVPTVTVTVLNPGASPQEIETEITDRLEEEINTVSGIDELRSTSVEGVSQVFVSFKLEKNGDVAAQEVRDKVNLIRNELPQTAEEPIIQKFDVNSSPIMQIAVSAPRSLRDLYDIADKQLAERIQTVDGVGQVQVIGGAEREIQIFINPERMRAYNVTANDVTDAVRRQNQELPGGRIDQGASEITVRTLGKLPKVEDFNQIPIVTRDGYTVRLKDIGEVRDAGKEQRTISLLNGVPSVTLNVRKQSGTNSLAIAEQVKHRLEELKKDLPSDVQTNIVGDQTVFIEASVHAVYEHLILGSLFACVIVFIFLWNFRLTLISAVAIPTSIIGTFAIMAMLGYTLDMITLLALTLMVGIVIDDAIIVMENIYHFIESKGMSPFQAAVEGTREVGLAVFATTLSLLAVFLPVGFMGGIVGRFMSSFGLTSSAAIAISLLVSFTLTPMLCALFIKANKKQPAENDGGGENLIQNQKSKIQDYDSKDSWVYRQIDAAYTWMLRWSMAHRWAIVGLCVLVLLSNVLVFSLIGFDFIPEDDESQYQVALRAPEGATLAATSTVAERIAKDIREFPGVTDTLTTVGGGEQEIVNTGTVYVKLKPIKERDVTQAELIARTRELLKQYPSDIRTSVSIVPAIGGGGERNEAVQYLITGPDLNKLSEYSDKLKERLRQVPGAVDVDSSLVVGKPELRVVINRQRAADLGVAVEDISQALNTFLAGSEVSTFNSGTDQFDVRVRARGNFRRTEQDLRQMSVRSEKGEVITLDQLVSFEEGAGAATIDRFDRERQVTIYSNVRQGGSVSAVTAEIENIVKELQFEPGYQPAVTGDAKRLAESGYYFGLAIVLTFIFMYMVLAAQFESFIHPITILLTLPLAVPFGVASLLLTGQSMNIFALLGLLVLFGIVKKNAILQIDHTNQLREQGMERDDAIIQANRDRLRPILMTTIAFVAGMIPMLISTGAGAATNRSIGTLVAGGQTFCLLLTLLAVPVFYSLFDDVGKLPIWNKMALRWKLLQRIIKRRILRPVWSTIVSASGQKMTSLLIVGLLTFSSVANAQEVKTLNPDVRQTDSVSRNVNQQTETPTTKEAAEAEKQGEVKTYESAPNFSRTGVNLSEPLSLSLQDAIKLALENNNDLRVAETEVKIAEFNLKAARGAFDPALVGESYYERAVTPTASTLQGGAGGKLKENTFSNVFALSGKAPKFGGEYRVEFSNSRVSSNSLFNDLNPQFPSRLSFSFTQPLWRGLRTDDTRRRIEVAKKNVSLSDAQFRERTINTISQVEAAYWEMVFALRNLQIQQDALKEAKAQLESNKRQVEQGVLAPIDIAQAETQVANIEQNLYAAQESVTNRENALKTLLLPSRESANWSRPVIPTSPVEIEIPRIALPNAIEAALKNRPELAQLETNKEINQINTRYLRDRTKPQIDLVASYTTQGLAGSVATNNAAGALFNNQDLRDRVNQLSALNNLPPLEDVPTGIGGVPENLQGGNGTSLNNLFRQDYPTYRVGVRIEIPVGNRAAKAELGSSLAEGTKLDYQRKQQEQTIEAEVRNAVEAVRTAEARLKSATFARESAQKQFESERRQLTAGTSTVFLVLERQTRLLEAQGRELQAQTDLNKAISNLQFTTGGLLNNYGIRLLEN
jgi:hydrophobic/amphiphilic exporter-1 (mainly G- bacteria), HAE1 family